MNTLHQQINALLVEKKHQSRLRQLNTANIISSTEVGVNGDILINFASNDYLGLSQHPLLKERAIEAINKYGVGSPSSRLISGNCELYGAIESEIARLKGTETALVFPSGFQTNVSVMVALSKLNTILLCDQLSHNSILLGAQWNKRQFARFAHNKVEDLNRLIQNNLEKKRTIWAVTESVFSMGSIAPIDDFLRLSETSDIHLYIDEAHATGVFGKNGMGFVHAPSSKNVVMGTFSKGVGSFGAYVACSSQFKDFLVNFCPGIIYTTALPPPVLGSIGAALELIPHMVPARQRLLKLAAWLKQEIRDTGFSTSYDQSQIVFIQVGKEDNALALSQYLSENKIYALAIRPPTVPENAAGIRLSLSAAHTDTQISHLVDTLKRWNNRKQKTF
jgi:8-amino-7-oxononanoate synthase